MCVRFVEVWKKLQYSDPFIATIAPSLVVKRDAEILSWPISTPSVTAAPDGLMGYRRGVVPIPEGSRVASPLG